MSWTKILVTGAISLLVASIASSGLVSAGGPQPPAVDLAPLDGAPGSEVTVSWTCAQDATVEVSPATVVEPAWSGLGDLLDTTTPSVVSDTSVAGSVRLVVPDQPVGTQLYWTVTCVGPVDENGDTVTVSGESPTFSVTGDDRHRRPAEPTGPPTTSPKRDAPATDSAAQAFEIITSAATSGATLTTVDATDDTGQWTSLQLDSSGFPVISYQDVTSGFLRLAICSEPTCSPAPTLRTLDAAGGTGRFTSLQLDGSGNPVISYQDVTGGNLRLARCSDPTCAAAPTLSTVDSVGDTGWFTSLALDGSGNPVISYYRGGGGLWLAHCVDLTCTAAPTLTEVDSVGDTGLDTSLQLDGSGNPVISYLDDDTDDLRLAHCNNPTCTAAPSLSTVDAAGDTGFNTSLQLNGSGNPVIAYYDDTNGSLRLAHCNNATCTASPTLNTVDDSGAGEFASLELDGSDNPVIGYFGSGGVGLAVAHCNNATCTASPTLTAVDPSGGPWASLELDGSGFPVISSYDFAQGDLRLAHCLNVTCSGAFDLTMNLVGSGAGTVTSSPGSIECPTACGGSFADGTVVSLTAVPETGSTVTQWQGCDSSPNADSCVVTVGSDRDVFVEFSGEGPPPSTTAVPTSSSTTTPDAPPTTQDTSSGQSESGLAFTGVNALAAVGLALILITAGSLAVRSRRGTT